MFKKWMVLLISICFSAHGAVVTNACDAGYMGDTLFNYIKAKYIAHKYNIPFQLNPHSYLNEFVLYDTEPRGQSHAQVIQVKHESQMNPINSHALYNVSYYCRMHGWADSFDVSTWDSALNDRAFRNEMRRLIYPKKGMTFSIPKDAIVIGVHVRKPLNPDYPIKSCQFYNSKKLSKRSEDRSFSDTGFPFKFVPDQYYVDQIKRIIQMYPNDKIVIYLYNNDPHADQLCAAYEREINNERVTVCDPNHGAQIPIFPADGWASHAAEDLVALSKFDYLIRGKSNYSQVSDFIGNHKIVIAPNDAAWYINEHGQDCLVVETVEIKVKKEDGSHIKNIVSNR